MEERRKFARMDFNTKVVWEKIDSNEPSGEFMSKDISGGGICLIVNNSIKVSDKLSIVLKLPSEKRIEVKGNVVWVESFEILGEKRGKRYEAGVEFIEISDGKRDEIMKFAFTLLANKQNQ